MGEGFVIHIFNVNKIIWLIKIQLVETFPPGVFHYEGHQYTYQDWGHYARLDGWLCRNDKDCNWIDANLRCNKKDFCVEHAAVST